MKSWTALWTLIILIGISVPAHADPTALVNTVMYDGHLYGLTNQGSNWLVAEAFAQSLGGHLVTVNDEAENTFLYNTFVVNPSGGVIDRWIGLNCPGCTADQALNEDNWAWASGEAVTYLNFRDDQPDGSISIEGDIYAAIGFRESGGWDNYPRIGVQGLPAGIVELVPEPASILLLATGLGFVGLGVWRKRK